MKASAGGSRSLWLQRCSFSLETIKKKKKLENTKRELANRLTNPGNDPFLSLCNSEHIHHWASRAESNSGHERTHTHSSEL